MDDIRSATEVLRGMMGCNGISEEQTEQLKGLVEFFAGLPSEKGLVFGDGQITYDGEWKDYDAKSAQNGAGTAVNLLYIGVLRLAGEHISSEYAEVAAVAERAAMERLYDKRVGLFRDADISLHYSKAVNALAVELKVFPHLGEGQISAYLKRKK